MSRFLKKYYFRYRFKIYIGYLNLYTGYTKWKTSVIKSFSSLIVLAKLDSLYRIWRTGSSGRPSEVSEERPTSADIALVNCTRELEISN